MPAAATIAAGASSEAQRPTANMSDGRDQQGGSPEQGDHDLGADPGEARGSARPRARSRAASAASGSRGGRCAGSDAAKDAGPAARTARGRHRVAHPEPCRGRWRRAHRTLSSVWMSAAGEPHGDPADGRAGERVHPVADGLLRPGGPIERSSRRSGRPRALVGAHALERDDPDGGGDGQHQQALLVGQLDPDARRASTPRASAVTADDHPVQGLRRDAVATALRRAAGRDGSSRRSS